MLSSSAPCAPTNMAVGRNCGQSFAQVTWSASLGALSYQAAAKDKDGQRLLCSSNGTSCRLEGLMCSQVYSVAVTAMDDNCSSNESSVEIIQTGQKEQERISIDTFCKTQRLNHYVMRPSPAAPCPPSQLNISVNCVNNSAVLTWTSSPNAVSYTGRAVSTDRHTVTCEAGMILGCQLNGLQCGKEYAFTVSSSDGDCQSPESEPVVHKTGVRERERAPLSSVFSPKPFHTNSPPPPFVSTCMNKHLYCTYCIFFFLPKISA